MISLAFTSPRGVSGKIAPLCFRRDLFLLDYDIPYADQSKGEGAVSAWSDLHAMLSNPTVRGLHISDDATRRCVKFTTAGDLQDHCLSNFSFPVRLVLLVSFSFGDELSERHICDTSSIDVLWAAPVRNSSDIGRTPCGRCPRSIRTRLSRCACLPSRFGYRQPVNGRRSTEHNCFYTLYLALERIYDFATQDMFSNFVRG